MRERSDLCIGTSAEEPEHVASLDMTISDVFYTIGVRFCDIRAHTRILLNRRLPLPAYETTFNDSQVSRGIFS